MTVRQALGGYHIHAIHLEDVTSFCLAQPSLIYSFWMLLWDSLAQLYYCFEEGVSLTPDNTLRQPPHSQPATVRLPLCTRSSFP
jgi:hypothetical protein